MDKIGFCPSTVSSHFVQVQARSPSSEGSEVLFQAEGRMPLTTCWPPLPKISPSQGPDERQVGADDLLGKVPLFPLESSRAATELAEQLRGLGVTATPGSGRGHGLGL
eukprot:s501_g2.t1